MDDQLFVDLPLIENEPEEQLSSPIGSIIHTHDSVTASGRKNTIKQGVDQMLVMNPDKIHLRQTIEDLKLQLRQLVQKKGLSDHSVVQLSQELDQYIVLFQRMNFKK